MLPFDSTSPTDSSVERSNKFSFRYGKEIPLEWVKSYSPTFTGANSDHGKYVPDPDDVEYYGPVYHDVDIFTTPYLA